MSINHLDIDVCKILYGNDDTVSVHWNISTLSKRLFEECFLRKWDEELLYVIVYDITNVVFNGHNANKWRKYPINRKEQHLFLQLPSNQTYIVDIVAVLPSSFYTILRSNSVHLRGDKLPPAMEPPLLPDWQQNRPDPPEWSHLFSTYSCYTKVSGESNE